MIWLESPTNPLLKVVDIRAIARLAATAGRHDRGRQHLRHALSPAPAGLRGRRRHPLRHQVPGRPLRRGQRRGRDPQRTRWRRSCASTRTPPARCPARSTAGSCSAAFGPSPSGWIAPAPTRRDPARPGWRAGRGQRGPLPRARGPSPAGAHPAPDAAARRRWSRSRSTAARWSPTGWPAATPIFTLAESLGAVESLIEVPAVMTHASVAGSPLEVPADLVRLSVGIEAVGGPRCRPRARPDRRLLAGLTTD